MVKEAFLRSTVPDAQINTNAKIRLFADGLHTKASIDQYLHFHKDSPEVVALGKMGIAAAILKAERQSSLRAIETSMSMIGNTWLMKLFHGMNADTDLNSYEKIFTNVSFICFNYDRCIEVGLFRAIRALTGANAHDIGEVLREHLRIWHPYGTVGSLSFDNVLLANPINGFPNEPVEFREVLEGHARLRTFTEGMNDDQMLEDLRYALWEAQQTVYLGFSFLDQNMEILKAPTTNPNSYVYASTFAMSPEDKEQAMWAMASGSAQVAQPASLRKENVKTFDLKASEFFDRLGNTLRR